MIDQYLRGQSEQEDHVIHLLFSANRWEAAYVSRADSVLSLSNLCSALIEDNVKSGVTVVVDRYYSSGCVYSAAKNNPLLSLEWARHPEEGLPRPDLCLFLELSPDEAAKRGGWGEERYEKHELQDRVRQLFATMKGSPDGDDFVSIDAGRSIEEVEQSIADAVERAYKHVDSSDLPLRRIQPW